MAVALVVSLTTTPQARAQMAVYDAAAHAETSQTLAQTIKILDSATQQLSQLTALKNALGSVGASSGGLASPLWNAELGWSDAAIGAVSS